MRILLGILLFHVLITGCLQTCAQNSNSITYGNNIEHGKYIFLRGFRMYYEIYGKGDPILFIPGNGGSANDFQYQLPFFSSMFMVIAADSRSQGKSVDKQDSLSFEMMADDYNSLLDSLHLDSCFVIGWSDGGINALLLAQRNPNKVKKLVIIGANLWPDSTALKPFLFSALKVEHNKPQKTGLTYEKKNIHKLKDLDYLQPHITLASLKKIQCPTLVISGDHDIIQLSHTVEIYENIPKSDLWVVPNSGHSIPINCYEDFNKQVLIFLAKPYHKIEGFESFN